MSRLDAYKPNLKKAAKMFGEATGIAGISMNQMMTGAKKVVAKGKDIYKKLEEREARKKKESPYTYDRVGNQLIRRKKRADEM